MLGQLFQNLGANWLKASAQITQPAAQDVPLSITEDAHTRSLLFPDPNTLNRSQSDAFPLPHNTAESVTAAWGAIFDNWNTEVGIDGSKDLRLLIARDEHGPRPKAVLYDSSALVQGSPKANRERNASRAFENGQPILGQNQKAGQRKMSVPTPTSSFVPGSTITRRSHARSSSSSFSFFGSPSPGPVSPGPLSRRHVRGSSIASIQEHETWRSKRSTKEAEDEINSYLDCMFGSTVSSYKGPSMRTHILPSRNVVGSPTSRPSFRRAYSNQQQPPRSPTLRSAQQDSSTIVLITRTFSLPVEDLRLSSGLGVKLDAAPAGRRRYSYKKRTESPDPTKSSPPLPLKQQKVRFYAVAIAIRVSSNTLVSQPSPYHMQRFGSLGTSLSPKASLSTTGSYFDSRVPKWGPNLARDSTIFGTSTSDFNTEVVMRHWDVISRTLINLQFELQKGLIQSLTDGLGISPRESQQFEEVQSLADRSMARVADAINTARVATGQRRWGVWRDEARWVGRWANAQQQDSFFGILITSYLANHNDWLDLISPLRLKRRYNRQVQAENVGESATIASRTVIVSSDKMTARRLIYLLSAFLPTYRSYHPTVSSSASTKGFSGSSSDVTSVLADHGAHSMPLQRYVPQDGNENGGVAQSLSKGVTIHGLRRADLPIKNHSERSRRTSAITLEGSAPALTLPIATQSVQLSRPDLPDRKSSDSLASANLMQNLRLTKSSTATFGNVKKDKSAPRRINGDDSNSHGKATSSGSSQGASSHGRGSSVFFGSSAGAGGGRLQSMVNEPSPPIHSKGAAKDADGTELPGSPFQTRNQPEGPEPERPLSSGLPFKMSVNEYDGIIDVDIPFAGYESPLASPEFGWTEKSSWEGKSLSPLASFLFSPLVSEQQPLRVAGWLKKLHQDWHLQAVKPYDGLEADIRSAMQAEPTPPTAVEPNLLENGPLERWINICTTVVCDCDSFSLKRLTLRRLCRLGPSSAQPPITPGSRPQSQPIPPANSLTQVTAQFVRDEITEEPLTETDETLADAIEKILAHSQPSSRTPSTHASRANSIHGPQKPTEEPAKEPTTEIPRKECEKVILGALEQIVKDAASDLTHDRHGTPTPGEETEEASGQPNLHRDVKGWLKEIEGSPAPLSLFEQSRC